MTAVQRTAPTTAAHNVLILVIQFVRQQVRTGAATSHAATVVLQRRRHGRVDVVRRRQRRLCIVGQHVVVTVAHRVFLVRHVEVVRHIAETFAQVRVQHLKDLTKAGTTVWSEFPAHGHQFVAVTKGEDVSLSHGRLCSSNCITSPG